VDRAVSGASCHPPAHAFTGGNPVPVGITGNRFLLVYQLSGDGGCQWVADDGRKLVRCEQVPEPLAAGDYAGHAAEVIPIAVAPARQVVGFGGDAMKTYAGSSSTQGSRAAPSNT